jgi:hypothetical protein
MILIELCASGKQAYLDELDAMLALETIRALRGDNYDEKIEKHQYECDMCHYWHLTSQDLP